MQKVDCSRNDIKSADGLSKSILHGVCSELICICVKNTDLLYV